MEVNPRRRRRSEETREENICPNQNERTTSSWWLSFIIFFLILFIGIISIRQLYNYFPFDQKQFQVWSWEKRNKQHHAMCSVIILVSVGTAISLYRGLRFQAIDNLVGHHSYIFFFMPFFFIVGWKGVKRFIDSVKNHCDFESFHGWVGYITVASFVFHSFMGFFLYFARNIICHSRTWWKIHRFFGLTIFTLIAYNVMHGLLVFPIEDVGSGPGGYNVLEDPTTKEMQKVKICFTIYITSLLIFITHRYFERPPPRR